MNGNQPKPVQMWKDGPRRMFSTERFLGAVPYAAAGLRGYAGAFICE